MSGRQPTTDRILDVIDAGLQSTTEASYGTDRDPASCARCLRHEPVDGDSDLCEGCRAFLLDDSDIDPKRSAADGFVVGSLVEFETQRILTSEMVRALQGVAFGMNAAFADAGQTMHQASMSVVPRGGISFPIYDEARTLNLELCQLDADDAPDGDAAPLFVIHVPAWPVWPDEPTSEALQRAGVLVDTTDPDAAGHVTATRTEVRVSQCEGCGAPAVPVTHGDGRGEALVWYAADGHPCAATRRSLSRNEPCGCGFSAVYDRPTVTSRIFYQAAPHQTAAHPAAAWLLAWALHLRGGDGPVAPAPGPFFDPATGARNPKWAEDPMRSAPDQGPHTSGGPRG